MFGIGIAFLLLAIIAVALRFYSMTLTKANYAADDWWIIVSLVFFSLFPLNWSAILESEPN